MDDPIALEFFRTERQAVVAFPKNSAFAAVIHKNESLLAGTAGRSEKMGFDAEARKFRAVQLGGDVVADFADVTRAQAPLPAGNHGGGDLAAGQHFRGTKFDLGPARGIVRDRNERVGGVETDADNIHFGRIRHEGPGHCNGSTEYFKGETVRSIEARGAPEGEAADNEKQEQDRGQKSGWSPVQGHLRDASHRRKDHEHAAGSHNQQPVQRAAGRF